MFHEAGVTVHGQCQLVKLFGCNKVIENDIVGLAVIVYQVSSSASKFNFEF